MFYIMFAHNFFNNALYILLDSNTSVPSGLHFLTRTVAIDEVKESLESFRHT